ncbi:nicotinate phosphoribosyltransferase/nicotinate-nucleotide diphosphorylase (carboxylating) [Acididesulfobacillus acetoxydans]|uniref:Probable nicotinate-nucleotide pyrophosphorylase [carboxylating] n=1 Tax=Acididesulfobacillus acetoxydans TaxID=1561005 RepID=A0A8S0WE80_9FIRM|nr:carboxylating nicotinate-nucleotide diphosphorylase [Acididesulfobacillus acetoxydans]CAA7599922.1 nicotinate phosphoribosyltransferase/nicotinate-nucleotide diphosphorylase (carboxylating) [Acididesulfobacillus acetoxydans]CEJ06864.1 Nicotinate-nucleotide pyrophosphorylase [carboxylating] [Acididesulfobacillus acetoxydans]
MFATFQLGEIVDRALREDVGTGDLSAQILAPDLTGQAKIYAKEKGIVAGLEVVEEVFRRVDPLIECRTFERDGTEVRTGNTVMELAGPLRGILQGERTALNFLQHLSGIATAARRAVELVKGLPVTITDTRKTLPGLRMLQKYAVTVGGGRNHRFGLYDAVMLKDNHLTAAGGVRPAVERVRERIGQMVKIEVECESLEQVEEAASCGADVIMLDNMPVQAMRQAVALVGHRALVEASGGIHEGNLREVAETGVDVISLGALTHSVKVLDFSLDVGQIKPSARRRWQAEKKDEGDGA